MDPERQIVIVGCGRYTQRDFTINGSKNPIEMLRESALLAAEDAHSSPSILKDVVAIGTMDMFLSRRWRQIFDEKMYSNLPRTLGNAIGANPEDDLCWHSAPGGNGPQKMINTFGDLLSKGKLPQGPILIAGCEVNKTFDTAVRDGTVKDLRTKREWGDSSSSDVPGKPPRAVNRHRRSAEMIPSVIQLFGTVIETAHVYASFENASIGRLHQAGSSDVVTRTEWKKRIGRLFSGFSQVASERPEHSWYPRRRESQEIVTTSDSNFLVSFPYTKNMCAIDRVDMSAALLLMSWAEAKRRGIPDDRMIFLRGSGDADDLELFPLRHRLDTSLAMRAAYEEAFRSSGLDIDSGDAKTFDAIDLYSCYPIAVECALRCLRLDPSAVDPKRLTCTGGLATHGGPGNNYVTHAVCALVETLRRKGKGRRDGGSMLGIVGANGGFMTEHSVGVYSTSAPERTFARRDPSTYAPDCGLPWNMLALAPTGRGRVLAWTVVYKRRPNVPERALVMGEMLSGADKGKRFIGWTAASDRQTVQWLMTHEGLGVGAKIDVRSHTGTKPVFGGKHHINDVVVESFEAGLSAL
eukprot:g1131.t1